MATIEALKKSAARILHGTSSTAALDAEILLSKACGLSRVQLISQSRDTVPVEREAVFRGYIERRRNFEPVAYIIGVKEFWGLVFEVSPTVLIPRPETELLVEEGLRTLAGRSDPLSILDLGTGSGCIAVSLAVELKRAGRNFRIVALDLSEAALQVAGANALRHGVAGYIETIQSNWFAALAPAHHVFDLILANPPYVRDKAVDISPETRFEPTTALFAGEDGLDAFRILFRDFPGHLKEDGAFVFEAGSDQQDKLEKLCREVSSCPQHVDLSFAAMYDLAGLFRGGVLRKAAPGRY